MPILGSDLTIVVAWLPEGQAPFTSWPDEVRLGNTRYAVGGINSSTESFASLAHTDPSNGSAGFLFQSPTWFSRNGRIYPLPDPVLMYSGLARRWNSHAPDPLGMSPEVVKSIAGGVELVECDGMTQEFDLGKFVRRGFVGSALFICANQGVWGHFAALSRFAEFCGVGAHTTHGGGCVELVDREVGGSAPGLIDDLWMS